MQSKQHSESTRKHMISLTNRHISSTDKGKLVYSTLALNQTRESVKNSSRPFYNSSFFYLALVTFLSRLLLTSSFSRTQKKIISSCRSSFDSNNLLSTRHDERHENYVRQLLLLFIYQFLKLSQQCRCYHIIVKDF